MEELNLCKKLADMYIAWSSRRRYLWCRFQSNWYPGCLLSQKMGFA